MCSIDKSIDKVSRYFWYRDISKYRQYRPSLVAVLALESWSPPPGASEAPPRGPREAPKQAPLPHPPPGPHRPSCIWRAPQ